MINTFFFFFSSRRRHTRSLRDWSSDVCSSDLTFQLTRSQLDSIYLSAINHQFFVLDSAYKSTALDGSFLELTIQAIGTSHYVRSMNIAVPALDSLVREVNAITPDSLD